MSAICSFYKDKTVFLTGGTGFIGKLIIDQLLRKTQPKRLYLFIREKKGVNSESRIEKLFQDVVFDSLKAKKPNFFEKIKVIPGDISKDSLGLSEEYIDRICEEVEIVIHGAATVSLNDDFKPVIDTNLKGSLSILKLCRKIKKLQVFTLISTAYSFCPYTEIKEELYKVHINSDDLIKLVDNFSETELKSKSKHILGKWPNPYSLSKALAEHATINQINYFPVVIIRPSIIMGTYNEPVPGWIGNYYGPTGIIAGAVTRVIQVAKIDPNEIANIIPGDMVASCVLSAAAYNNSASRCSKINAIYNCVACKENCINWKAFSMITGNHPYLSSLSEIFWSSNVKLEPNPYLFQFYSLLFHLIPSYCIDLYLRCVNRKPRMVKTAKMVSSFLNCIAYFGIRTWHFSNDNTVKLWNELNNEDRLLFNFNSKCIDWQHYISNCATGVLIYLLDLKVDLNNDTYFRPKTLQRIMRTIFYGFITYILWKNEFASWIVDFFL